MTTETEPLKLVEMRQDPYDTSAMIKERRTPGQRSAVLCVIGAALLWSTSYVVTKTGVTEVPPLTYGGVRYLFAAAFVLLAALFTRRLERVPLRDILRLGLGGLLGITAYFAFQNLGIQRTSASEATLLVAAFPVITMLLEMLIYRQKASLLRFAGAGLALLGVYLVVGQSGVDAHPQRLLGDLCLLAAGFSWALYNFVTRDVVLRYSMFTVIFWQTLAGSAAFLPLMLLEAPAWQPISPQALLGMLYLGVFCSTLAFILYGLGLKRLDPGSAVGLLNLVPIFGLALAMLVLKETVTLLQALGGVIVILGVSLNVREESSAKDSACDGSVAA